jgi:hypothetical protein
MKITEYNKTHFLNSLSEIKIPEKPRRMIGVSHKKLTI